MKIVVRIPGAVVVTGLVVLVYALLRSKIDPVVIVHGPNSGLTGEFAPNDALSSATLVLQGVGVGPEDIGVGALPQSSITPDRSYAFILGLNDEGTVIHNLQQPQSPFGAITGATRVDRRLYILSLETDAIGVCSCRRNLLNPADQPSCRASAGGCADENRQSIQLFNGSAVVADAYWLCQKPERKKIIFQRRRPE